MNPRTLLPLIALVVACGPEPPPNNPVPPPPTGPVATTPPPATTTTAAPTTTTTTTAAPPPLDHAALLTALTTARAKGMKPEGGIFGGPVQAGGAHDHPFQLAAHRCYSVVAVGIGVTEVDINIVGQLGPIPEQVLSQDNDTGSQAVLGPDGNCFKNPLPVGGPAKIRLKATAGSGQVYGQLLVK